MPVKIGILLAGILGCAALPAFGQSDNYSVLTQNDGLPCQPQRGANDSYYSSGCCGGPGLRSCATILHPGKGPDAGSYGCTDPDQNIIRFDSLWIANVPSLQLPYNPPSAYYCNLPWPPAPENSRVLPTERPSAGTDFTFYVTSDLHFWRSGIDFNIQIAHATALNGFAKAPPGWPSGQAVNAFGSTFHAPAAIVIPGDFSTGPITQRVGAYRLNWESGWVTGSINFPVYPGFGNHDISENATGTDDTWGPATPEDAQRAWDYIMNRTLTFNADRNHTGCLIGVDSNCLDEFDLGGSLNYSWDWEGVHLVMLHTWAGDTQRGYTPPLGSDGLTWLKNDLARAVGTSGRPVILFQHYGADSKSTSSQVPGTEWGQTEIDRLMNVVGGYNVIGLFAGHTHRFWAGSLTGTSAALNKSISFDSISDGSGGDCGSVYCSNGNGDFMAVHVTDRYMEVGAVTWNASIPGLFTLDPNDSRINQTYDSNGNPVSRWATDVSFPGGAGVCRKLIDSTLLAVDPSKVSAITDPNNSGQIVVKNLTSQALPGTFLLRGSFSNWDFTDNCSGGGSTYLIASQNGIPANGQISLPSSGGAKSTLSLYTLSDFVTVSPSSANLTATQPVSIQVATIAGASVPFNFTVDQPWVSLNVTGPNTPATITATLVPQTSYSSDFLTLTITPTNPAYQPVTVRLYVTVPVQITSNIPGGQVSVDGISYTTPVSTAVRLGDVQLNAAPPLASGGYKYAFQSWSDGNSQKHDITASGPINLSVTFSEFDQVTYTISPAGSGTVQITPALETGFVAKNTTIQIIATPASNYYLSSFGGALAGIRLSSPMNVTIGAPTNFTVNFTPYPTVTLTTNIPASESYNVTAGPDTGPAPQSAPIPPNSTAGLSVPSLVPSRNPGVQYMFQQWADGGNTPGRVVSVGTSNATYQANYLTQVRIDYSTAPPGSGSVTGSGWVTVGSTVSLTAQPAPGYVFLGFAYNGGLTASNPLTFTAQTPLVVTANFTPAATIVIDSTPQGLPFSVDNGATPFRTPATFQWAVNSQHTVAFGAIVAGPTGVQYQFNNWNDVSAPYVRAFTTGPSNATYTAAFTTQYLVTTPASPANGGVVTGGGWQNAGSSASIQAKAANGYAFSGFSGDLNGTANPASITVSKPLNIVANFAPSPAPALYAAPNGAATDSNGMRIVPLLLENTGSGEARGAQIDSVGSIAILSGTGPVTAQAGPFMFGDIAAGGAASGTVSLTWPATAKRIRMTVNFSANNGAYHGSTTLNLFR